MARNETGHSQCDSRTQTGPQNRSDHLTVAKDKSAVLTCETKLWVKSCSLWIGKTGRLWSCHIGGMRERETARLFGTLRKGLANILRHGLALNRPQFAAG